MSAVLFLLLLEAAAAGPPTADSADASPPHAIRVRGGVEIGPAFMYSRYRYALPGGSLVGHIGLQLRPMVAVMYHGGLAFFGGEALFDDIIDSPSYVAVQNTPMVIVTPIDFFELGLGPAIDGVIDHEDFDSGVALGLDARVGFHIPLGPQEPRRFGLGIALDFRPVNLFREINDDFWLLHFQLGVGVDWY